MGLILAMVVYLTVLTIANHSLSLGGLPGIVLGALEGPRLCTERLFLRAPLTAGRSACYAACLGARHACRQEGLEEILQPPKEQEVPGWPASW